MMNIKQYNNFVYWMNERQRIYEAKEAGEPRPWTKDKILQRYKFTNVFREQDRTTKDLRRRMFKGDNMIKTFRRILVFRMFNWTPTYDELHSKGLVLGWKQIRAKKVLHARARRKEKVFTGAYIITNGGSSRPKIDVVCEGITKSYMDAPEIVSQIRSYNSIESAVDILSRYPMIGKFVGYELATDLTHTKILSTPVDRFTWANPGPGARRGLNRIFREHYRDRAKSTEDYVAEMRFLLEKIYCLSDGTGLEMRDIEHSLCEFDKYMRLVNGEGKVRSKYDGT